MCGVVWRGGNECSGTACNVCVVSTRGCERCGWYECNDVLGTSEQGISKVVIQVGVDGVKSFINYFFF